MLKFMFKLFVFFVITAAGSFWANEHFGGRKIPQMIARPLLSETPIAALIQTPKRFDGELVKVSGKAVTNMKISALGYGAQSPRRWIK